MKKLIALILALVMVMGLVACGEKAPVETQAPDAPATEAPADDAPATDAPATYAIVCKDASNPYMSRMVSGFKEACESLGITAIEKSPETTSADDQITIINELVAQGVKGIAIAANDAAALKGAIEAAKQQGVVVVTLDSDTAGSQMFVNQAGVTEVAQVLVDSVADMCGEDGGEFAILSASSTATNQNAWIAAMEEILKDEKYANLTLVETVYGDDESQKSTDEMQNLMTKYPDLEVVCCPTTVGILAAAQVVTNTPDCGIKIAGLGLPSEMKDYTGDDKACPYMYLWNPIDVGNCGAHMIKAIADGLVGDVGTEFTADNGQTYAVTAGDPAEKQIIVGPPFAFTGENIAEWASVY